MAPLDDAALWTLAQLFAALVPPVGIGGVLDCMGVDEILDDADRLLSDEAPPGAA